MAIIKAFAVGAALALLFVAFIWVIGPVACTSPSTARRVLEEQGYKDIKLTGFRLMGCGQGDTFSDGFEATNVNGKRVHGVVCSSFTKSATIRFD
jgi:hypothetical protein